MSRTGFHFGSEGPLSDFFFIFRQIRPYCAAPRSHSFQFAIHGRSHPRLPRRSDTNVLCAYAHSVSSLRSCSILDTVDYLLVFGVGRVSGAPFVCYSASPGHRVRLISLPIVLRRQSTKSPAPQFARYHDNVCIFIPLPASPITRETQVRLRRRSLSMSCRFSGHEVSPVPSQGPPLFAAVGTPARLFQ